MLKKHSGGFSLLEVIVAIALIGIIGVAFLMGLAGASKSISVADERATAESIARSQMEYIKSIEYLEGVTEYPSEPIPHPDYSTIIRAEPVHNPEEGLQLITITIQHFGNEVLTLEGYKVDR